MEATADHFMNLRLADPVTEAVCAGDVQRPALWGSTGPTGFVSFAIAPV